ncbi:MAG: cytochrome c biogenesis protein DipZ, partial [Betaproteobacteria bacterium AqS2]|nr:cytochrome c biogenesis protein DipZ [Betaproteobacteria bacterium AqS2]
MAARLRLLLCALPLLLAVPAWSAPPQLPELAYPFADQAGQWINSEPLSVRELRGRPVLVMFWSYGCHNCRNSLAWVKEMHRRFA